MVYEEKEQHLGEKWSILKVLILLCKEGVFSDTCPPDCAHISCPYKRDSSPILSCLISGPSVWR